MATMLRLCGSARLPVLRVARIRAVPALFGQRVTVRNHCEEPVDPKAKDVTFSFVDKDGKRFAVKAKEGQNLVHVAHENDVELEGACECSLACSTCHVVLKPEIYSSLEPATDEEEDLLDLAFGLTASSRLGCQVKVTTEFQDTEVQLPSATRNFYVDGHKPKPH